jgi:hypothetical protein
VALDSGVVARIDLTSVSSIRAFFLKSQGSFHESEPKVGSLKSSTCQNDELSKRYGIQYPKKEMRSTSTAWSLVTAILSENSERIGCAISGRSSTFGRFHLTMAKTYMGKRSGNAIVDAFRSSML